MKSSIQGQILINGAPLSKMRHWFVRNTGYVRQLATYYYNELTVRENLLFSMNMQAMRGMSVKQKLGRVEQVIREVGIVYRWWRSGILVYEEKGNYLTSMAGDCI